MGVEKQKLISSADINHLTANEILATDHPNPDSYNPNKWITNWLRQTFLRKATESKGFGSRVYISRGDSLNQRRLLNEKEIIDFLSKRGFSTYHLSSLSFGDQVSLFQGAEFVIGVHGAGLTNLAFASEGTRVIELFGKGYSPRHFEKTSAHNKLAYTPITSDEVETGKSPLESNFSISLSALEKHMH